MSVKHFLTLNDLSPDELIHVINNGIELKKHKKNPPHLLKDKVLAMIFEKASTRTRVSFEAGIRKLGGSALFLSSKDTQLGRGEPIKDSARVISSMVDLVMIRTFEHNIVEEFAEYSTVPIINGLTDQSHPCQLLADMMTYVEHRGSIKGKKVAWIGDGNNMCHSYMQAAKQFGFNLAIASPEGYLPNPAFINDSISLEKSAAAAAAGADLVVTDVWASMGQEEEQTKREAAFADYQVNDRIIATAHKDVVFMHCLPAHRGEEVSESVLEGKHSVVWDEAENRMHAQNALMVYLAP